MRLQEIFAEEPTTWRLFPAKGEVFEEEGSVGSHVVTFETGKLARFASGAVVVGIKDTKVLATVVGANRLEEGKSFMPLQVDYREKQYAQGKIPNTFMRREGAPKERELLVSRIIDRSIRPLFPKGYYYESQVMANVLSSDGEQDPDVMAANAASAALMVSDIPWDGPVGVVRLGRIDGKFVVNPDMDELAVSDLNLVYACTLDKTIMMETQAREISNKDLQSAFHLAHAEASKLIPPQLRLASKVQNRKRLVKTITVEKEVLEKIRSKAESGIAAVMGDSSYGKFERGKALSNIQDEVGIMLKEEDDEKSLKVLPLAFDQIRKEVVRRNIFTKGVRVDGRDLTAVRDLQCEIGLYPPLHGSSLFSRGNTQVLCTVTLGAPEDAQKLDSLVGPPKKRFMVHYSFPPYSINEVGKFMGLNRREVGHGTLAEKALLALLPPEDDFPYSVRVTSEVMASDGSSSMATVCGGSLALMDAGVPLRGHVAGVSIGLVTDVNKDTGDIKDYRLLTDILGLEDHVGDMDFKIAGTRAGITAIQLDIKPAGIPLNILCEALEPAAVARQHILDFMEQEIREPRSEQKENVPRKGHFSIQREYVGRLIGPQGNTVKNIQRVTGVRITVSDDGRVCVIAKDQASYDQAKEMVQSTVGKEIEVGNMYDGIVVSIKDFGAFVELDGGHQGLLHISELSHEKVTRVTDALIVGEKLKVMCIGRDLRGNLKLSRKATIPLKTMGETTQPEVSGDASTVVSKAEQVVVYEFPSLGARGNKVGAFPRASLDEAISKVTERKTTVVLSETLVDTATQGVQVKVPVSAGHDAPSSSLERQSTGGNDSKDVMEKKDNYKAEGCKQDIVVEVGGEYQVSVHQLKALGAVLRMSNGVLGKLFYTQETDSSSLHLGDQLFVRCDRIDQTGRPVFKLKADPCRHSAAM